VSDAIDRDAVEAILRRRVDGCYGDCTTQCLSCAAKEDIEEIRALPAVPPAAERRNCLRLRIDKDDTMGVTIWNGTARVWMDGDSLSGEEWASTDLASVVRWIRAQTDQFTAAFRAAKPDSTGAAPPAAEPAIFQKPGSSLDEGSVRCNNPEPAAQPFRHGRCCAEEPKEPAPCGTCAPPKCAVHGLPLPCPARECGGAA